VHHSGDEKGLFALAGSGVSLHGSNSEPLMSALGQKQTLRRPRSTSALPPKADIVQHGGNVRFVPIADILHCSEERRYSITSSAMASSDGGMVKSSIVAV
jgi:hypothetical protein